MKLLTQAILKKLPKLYASENKTPEDTQVVVKFFDPAGAATWYITEFDGEDTFFGLCDLGFGTQELGYVSLSELKSIKGRLGIGIERDMYLGKMTLAEAMKEARYLVA